MREAQREVSTRQILDLVEAGVTLEELVSEDVRKIARDHHLNSEEVELLKWLQKHFWYHHGDENWKSATGNSGDTPLFPGDLYTTSVTVIGTNIEGILELFP